MRRLFCIFLLMCLPLHGFAMQWGPLLAEGNTIAHELAHDEHVQHHHEDDGSIHYDDSDESADHLLDHPASAQPVHILALLIPAAPEQLVSTVQRFAPSYVPYPYLDSPHRPPALTLG